MCGEVTSYHTPDTRGFTLERSHISVLNVIKLLHRSQILSDTRGFTLERSHISVLNVIKLLLSEVTSYHTPEDSHWREVISVF
ncbi:unnamed protein product [Staurois parvus]|uniref:Uncharacterized protein n=1 Tax=Staurois parvus TaxID=386267 RepID=A0ABN9HJP0_9NEOB|nr:unnamed protein product [Staurois parvus]